MSSDVSDGYFSIDLPDWLGLGDKLWHLSKLHSLGRLLNYEYVHSPFRCARSSHRSYLRSIAIGNATKILQDSRRKSDYLGKFLALESREKI